MVGLKAQPNQEHHNPPYLVYYDETMQFIVGEAKSYQRLVNVPESSAIFISGGRVTKLNTTEYQINLLHDRVDSLCPEDLFSLS